MSCKQYPLLEQPYGANLFTADGNLYRPRDSVFPMRKTPVQVRFTPALFKIRQACGDGVYFGQCTVTMVKFQGVCHGSLHKGLTTLFLMGEMAPFPLPFS